MTSFCTSSLNRRLVSGVFFISLLSSVSRPSRISKSVYDADRMLVSLLESAFDLGAFAVVADSGVDEASNRSTDDDAMPCWKYLLPMLEA